MGGIRGRRTPGASLLVAAVVACLAAAPAQATVTAVEAADQDGPNDSFYTNEILYAVGVNNALGGGAELCVVDAGVTDGDCAEVAKWGSPNAIATHGTFPPQPIEAPLLPEGTYRILADNGDDGDVVSSQFTVIPCSPGDDCSTELAQEQMQEWKNAAAAVRTGMGAMCLGSTVFSGGAAGMAGSALLGSGRRGAIMAEIKGDGVSLAFGPRQSQGASMALLRTVSCGAFVMYDDIVADPPDPDYKHLEEPAPEPLQYLIASEPEVGAAAQTLEDVRSQGVAHRIGVERYQGAVLDGNEGWAAVLADRVGDQALATQAGMRRLGRELRSAAVALADDGLAAATPQQLGDAREIRERVRTVGFTADERAQLVAEGLTDAEIAEVRVQLGAPLPVGSTPMAPQDAAAYAADRVDEATCVDETDLCGFDILGRAASAVGGNGRIPPTVSVSALSVREGDVGMNHGRVLVELSHPSLDGSDGSLTLTPQTTAEDEVRLPRAEWFIGAGQTRTYRSVAVVNDTADEPAETAELTAVPRFGDPSAPAAVTVLDDDGPGDPPTPVRGERGLIAMLAGNEGGSALFLSGPDATELTSVHDGASLSQHALIAWTPGGRWLLVQAIAPTASALAANGEPIYRLRVTGEGEVQGEPGLAVPGKPWSSTPSLSPDGRRLLAAQGDGGTYKLVVRPFDPVTGEVGEPHVTGDDPPLANWWSGHGASFSPDGRRIAFAGCSPGLDECGIWVVPVNDAGVATGPPAAAHRAPINSAYFPSWSPDGRFLAFREIVDGEFGVRTLRVDADGRPLAATRLVSGLTPYWSPGYPAWSPDSRSLAYATPTDPLLADNAGGSAFAVDLDAAGAAVGTGKQLGLAGWAPQVVWGSLPDDAPPVTTAAVSPDADGDGVHRSPVTVSLQATDNRGVASLEYAVDGAARSVQGDRTSFALDGTGTYTVRFRARDASGNLEAWRERVVRVELPVASPPPPPPPPPPPVVRSPAVVPAASLPSNRRCVSRRRFRIRLRQTKQDPLVRVSVFLGGKRVRVASGKRLTAVIDLRGLPKGKFTVRIVGTTRSGAKALSKRTYRTCRPKRRR
jgi:hypothetical protein